MNNNNIQIGGHPIVNGLTLLKCGILEGYSTSRQMI